MFSILNRQENITEKTHPEQPAFFTDLNLDQIIERICADWGEDLSGLYHTLPADPETENYRRAVFADAKKEGVLQLLSDFLERMKLRTAYMEQAESVEDDLQKKIWFIRETVCYAEAIETLREGLGAVSLSSEGMMGLKELLDRCISDASYQAFREAVFKLYRELTGFRVLLSYGKDRFIITKGEGKGSYGEDLEAWFPESHRTLKSPFLASPELSDLEQEIIRIFQKEHRSFFEEADRFYKCYRSYADAEILLLQRETAYYVAYLRFMRKMQEQGLEFCTPTVSKGRLSAAGLYDLALALVNLENGKTVVGNETEMDAQEDFFVLTGPNQGGKTTFARSLGQLIYFTKMGLDVPARDALVPYYSEILTHFSVEESVETGRGKLMDELVRLKPMMGEQKAGAFVVINELFTTAANYDACIMGKKVLEYFIARHCKGIYVTHLNELSKACPSVVSLRASVDENMVQTYLIRREEAKELAGANRQALKYGLTYRQMKERFL